MSHHSSSRGEAGAHVQPELFPPAHRGGHREHEQPPGADVEAGARPDRAPGVARDQILEVSRSRRRRERLVHVRVAEHRATHAHAGLAHVGARLEQKPEQRRRERRAAVSRFDRCAVGRWTTRAPRMRARARRRDRSTAATRRGRRRSIRVGTWICRGSAAESMSRIAAQQPA